MDPKEASKIGKNVPKTVYVLVQDPALTPDSVHFEKTFSKKAVRGLAITQLILASVAVTSQIGLLANGPDGSRGIAHAGAGIWCGAVFAVSGSLGLMSANRMTKCSIIAFMVTSIVCATICLPFIILSSVGLGTWYGQSYDRAGVETLYSIQIVVSLIVAAAAIASAAIACRAVCCRSMGKAILISPYRFQGPSAPLDTLPAGSWGNTNVPCYDSVAL